MGFSNARVISMITHISSPAVLRHGVCSRAVTVQLVRHGLCSRFEQMQTVGMVQYLVSCTPACDIMQTMGMVQYFRQTSPRPICIMPYLCIRKFLFLFFCSRSRDCPGSRSSGRP